MSTASLTRPASLNPFASPALANLWPNVFPSDTALAEPKAPQAAEVGDAAWIARIRCGDEEAARALVQRLYPMIIKLIRCHLPRRSTEEDLAQTVFAKVFAKLDQF